jgi:endonuclease YncB( thermonuclease family)
LIVDDQSRKVEYFVDGDTISVIDQNGDSVGFQFNSDKMKEVKR